ncbi:MAG: hypothetical protein ACO1OB_02240 [Archangium sp.]
MRTDDQLIRHFGKAGLPLELVDHPIVWGSGMRDIVQIDVARPDRRSRAERFRLFTGARDNRVEVEGIDKHLRQLVMLVHEPRRRFETVVTKYGGVREPANVVREEKNHWVVENFTQSNKRHFLAGMDEQHLFIAQLPRATSTVWGAHQALRSDELRRAERGAFEKTVRQGEWFFVSLQPRELREVEAEGARKLPRVRRDVGIAEAAGIRRGGRPHVADEVLMVEGRVYVRGKVRHPDHATVEVRPWRRAIVNTESFSQPQGVGFVD